MRRTSLMPAAPQEIEQAARGIQFVSSHRLIKGCVTALDGPLIKIKGPSSKDAAGHVKAFILGIAMSMEQISKQPPVTQIADLFVPPHCVLVESMICMFTRAHNFQTWLKIFPNGGAQLETMPTAQLNVCSPLSLAHREREVNQEEHTTSVFHSVKSELRWHLVGWLASGKFQRLLWCHLWRVQSSRLCTAS